MKKKLKNKAFSVLIGGILLFFSSCEGDKKSSGQEGHPHAGEMYTCPMSEDSVFSDKPGSCPKCGMDLVKMEQIKKLDTASVYQCPMFCDSLRFGKPGTCPVCGMDLEKVEKQEPHRHTQQPKVYTCPMHPEIIREEPGQCPICGMDLVEKLEGSNAEKLGLGAIVSPVNRTVLATLKTIQPVEKSLPQTVEALGYITYNPKNAVSISARYGGRIEKLYVKYNFQYVQKGQKLLDIYSPELLTAQENLVFLLNSDMDNREQIQSSKRQLQLLGMNKDQVDNLLKTKKIMRSTSLYAAASGHIHEMQNLTDLTMPNMQMGTQGNSGMSKEPSKSGLSIREGMYLEKGQTIFSVVSTEKLWAILKIYSEDVEKVRLHQEVEIYSEMHPEKIYKDHIDFLEPSYDPESKHLSARVYLENCDHHELKIGSLIKAKITTTAQKSLWVPKQAVLDLGGFEYVVFLKTEEAFTAHKVVIGKKVGDQVEIKKGLDTSDEIAYDAQYLVDSEGFVTLTP
jgi:Cu(I)/Ag(I) efflux system membrane fusion protein